MCNFIAGCFVVVSQVLNQGVHLVTGCQAMAQLLRPVRKMAKSFRWNRQVQRITPFYPYCLFIIKAEHNTVLTVPAVKETK